MLGLEAGACKVVVTPEKPVYLAGLGYGRLSEGVHDDLYARALAVSDGEKAVVLVGVDSIGLMYDHIRPLEERLAAKGALLVLGSTHDHSSPDVIGLWGPEPGVSGLDPDYLEYLLRGVEEAAEGALEDLSRASLDIGRATLPPGVARNTRDPGLVDVEISYMVVRRGSEAVGLVANFGLHPEVLWRDNRLITADFVYYMLSELERSLGGIGVFLNGALGGMVTPDVKAHTFEEAMRVGASIASSILRELEKSRIRWEALGELRAARRRLTLPVHNDSLLEAVKAGVVDRRIIGSSSVETEICLIELWPLAQMATLPGEALPRVALKVKALMRRPFKFLVSLCNDEVGYILDPEEWRPSGYEESMSLGPLTADLLLSGLAELFNMLGR